MPGEDAMPPLLVPLITPPFRPKPQVLPISFATTHYFSTRAQRATTVIYRICDWPPIAFAFATHGAARTLGST